MDKMHEASKQHGKGHEKKEMGEHGNKGPKEHGKGGGKGKGH